jgi:transposase-like protein
MANQLGMDKVQAICALHEVGWSNRRIARELGIHRTTVAGYLETHGDSKPTGPTSGRCPPTGSDEANERSRSLCEPYRESNCLCTQFKWNSVGRIRADGSSQ